MIEKSSSPQSGYSTVCNSCGQIFVNVYAPNSTTAWNCTRQNETQQMNAENNPAPRSEEKVNRRIVEKMYYACLQCGAPTLVTSQHPRYDWRIPATLAFLFTVGLYPRDASKIVYFALYLLMSMAASIALYSIYLVKRTKILMPETCQYCGSSNQYIVPVETVVSRTFTCPNCGSDSLKYQREE